MNKTKKESKIEWIDNPLKQYVYDSVMDNKDGYSDKGQGFIEDVLKGGCQSGIVGELIYYKDTIEFYDKYEEWIEDLISENMDMLGIETRPLFIESLNGSAENLTQEKNLLSWFAYEETIRELQAVLDLPSSYEMLKEDK